jgi:hypothetical protein
MSHEPFDRAAALAAITLLCGAGAFWLALIAWLAS